MDRTGEGADRMPEERLTGSTTSGLRGPPTLTLEEIASETNLRKAGACPHESEWISKALLQDSYRPRRSRTHPIPKSRDLGDGSRVLGIPTRIDKIVQKAFNQRLSPLWEPLFHDSSYGFRPDRGVPAAVRRAQELVNEGRVFVVAVDIERFFDNVLREPLIEKALGIDLDPRIAAHLRRVIAAPGGGDRGIPQGAPLSPLLSNIYLNDFDQELGKDLCFIRYADDIKVFARSARSGLRNLSRVEAGLRRIGLAVNKDKCGVRPAAEVDILGFTVSPSLTCSTSFLSKVAGRLRDAGFHKRRELYLRNLNLYLKPFSLSLVVSPTLVPSCIPIPLPHATADATVERHLQDLIQETGNGAGGPEATPRPGVSATPQCAATTCSHTERRRFQRSEDYCLSLFRPRVG